MTRTTSAAPHETVLCAAHTEKLSTPALLAESYHNRGTQRKQSSAACTEHTPYAPLHDLDRCELVKLSAALLGGIPQPIDDVLARTARHSAKQIRGIWSSTSQR
jgi:hypothetical protein